MWNGVLIDSLDDVAANKLMAMFDRNEPKDVFDIYFLLTKGGYSPDKLLELTEKKFGVRFSGGLILSEAFKKMKDLDSLRPLMLRETKEEQDELLAKIKNYFIAQSKKFLDQTLR